MLDRDDDAALTPTIEALFADLNRFEPTFDALGVHGQMVWMERPADAQGIIILDVYYPTRAMPQLTIAWTSAIFPRDDILRHLPLFVTRTNAILDRLIARVERPIRRIHLGG